MTRPPNPGHEAPTREAAPARTGLYFCRCGPNLGDVVRLGELEDPRAWPAAADVATHAVLCSEEGKAWLAERIRALGLERVVVAACSPREHEHTFRGVLATAGRSPFELAMVNLREQVEWIGGDPAAATSRSRRLVAAALRRVVLQRPLLRREVEVNADVLVIGGGAAGISAALALAGKSRKVILVERERVLGGLANQLDQIFPDEECASCFLEPALDRVLHSDQVEVLTGAEVRRVRGAAGGFAVEVAIRGRGVDPASCIGCGTCATRCPVALPDPFSGGLATRKAIGLAYRGCLPHVSAIDRGACLHWKGEPCDACATGCAFGAVRLDDGPSVRELAVGAVVVATGLRPGVVHGPEGVVSSYALERMLHPDGPTGGKLRGAGGREPRSVLLATTALEEDGDLATEELLKLARRIRGVTPGARVAVAGGLDRIPSLARRAAALARDGVELLAVAVVPGGVTPGVAGLSVALADGSTRVADLVAIHAPSRPAEGADALARLLRIDATARGFLDERGASPFEPTGTRIAGVYVAGAAAGPRDVRRAIRDGVAAAALVHASLVPGEKRALEPLAAEVDASVCSGCGACVSACPFGAIVVRPGLRKAEVEALHCRGCGTCAAACPTGAASARHFTREEIAAEISALLAG